MPSRATNVKATLVETEGSKFEALERAGPGSFYYYRFLDGDDDAGIIHTCPCGCGMLGSLPLVKQPGRPCWQRSGTREKPTLTPSVLIHDLTGKEEHWHGHLRDGVWEAI